jgi:hypothetical protein
MVSGPSEDLAQRFMSLRRNWPENEDLGPAMAQQLVGDSFMIQNAVRTSKSQPLTSKMGENQRLAGIQSLRPETGSLLHVPLGLGG